MTVKNLIQNMIAIAGMLLSANSVNAAVIQYDFIAEAASNEGGYTSYSTDGNSAGSVILTATASNFAGTTSYYAYLDDLDGTRPAGLGACRALVAGEGSDCLVSSDDNLGSGIVGGEMLTLTWDQVVTINEIAFRNGVHRAEFATFQNVEIRIDGGSWTQFTLGSLVGGLLTTPLTGSKFDFIVDDTFGYGGCTVALCADGSGSEIYISGITIETPEPGMVVLFLLGMGLIAFSNRKRNQVQL